MSLIVEPVGIVCQFVLWYPLVAVLTRVVLVQPIYTKITHFRGSLWLCDLYTH